MIYKAPGWLPGGHLQTIWAARGARRTSCALPHYQRERWTTPDGDFIDVDYLPVPGLTTVEERPLLVLFHGLEGNSRSHYALAFAEYAQRNHMDYVVPHFRGCGGDMNLAPRAYHSGDYEEVHWILRRLREHHHGPMVAVGFSLGGNALLRWAQEAGSDAGQTVCAVAAICAPLDLTAAGYALGRGFNLHVYTRMFLRSLKPKALKKLQQHPGLYDRERVIAARNLYEFDNVVTAPLHGYRDTLDYWSRASAKPHLHRIAIPSLLLNAQNDPFIPPDSLPTQQQLNGSAAPVTLWQTRQGGHIGFVHGRLPPGTLSALPEAVGAWLLQHLR